MVIGSGLGGSIGLKKETTFGTGVTVDRWLPAASFGVQAVIEQTPVDGIAAGRLAAVEQIITKRRGTGQLVCQVPTNKFGAILQGTWGVTPTPTQQAATTAYLQTYTTLADNYGFSYTVQAGAPLAGGTMAQFTGTGGKILALELSSDISGVLNATVDFDFQNVVDATVYASPTQVASSVLGGSGGAAGGCVVKLGTYSSEAAITGVRGISVKIERTTGELAGAVGAQPEGPSLGAVVSGTIETDWVNKTYFNDRYLAGTPTSLVVDWYGSLIASTYYNQVGVTCPKVYFGQSSPVVDGPNVIGVSVPFTAALDTTNGLALARYQSTDTAL